jgi:hypothetical protein
LVLVALGVGVVAFVAGLQFGGGPSRQTAVLGATSPQPTQSESASSARTEPAFVTASPLASPPGSSRFVRTFDATKVIEALPGGTDCVGGSPGSWITPRTGTSPHETFVKTWLTSCPIVLAKRDAFLEQVLHAIADVDNPIWDGAGGAMAVTTYEESGFIGWVTVATRASADGVEIAVTVEEQPASFAGLDTIRTPASSATPVALPTMPVSLPPVEPLPVSGVLPPGTYSLANPASAESGNCTGGCADYQRIIFTLPAGWATSDGLVYKHLDQTGEVAFSAWTVDQVYADPCHWQGSALSPLDLASHSPDATGAIILAPEDGGLANQAFRGPRPRVLTQVTLGGVAALKIELSVPAQLDLATCDRGQFRSWTEWNVVDGANSHNGPGQLDDVYMVDVDRAALVIDASHLPTSSQQDVAELEVVLASMIIDR